MVRELGRPGIMLDRIFSETKLRNGDCPGGDGYYVRTKDGKKIGMKPAGGIRTAKQSLHYLAMVKETLGDAWLSPDWFRFGASSLADDVLRQIVRRKTGRYTAGYDFGVA